jgi:hypothetical protein
MIVDAILIATGVGAGAAKIAWGMVVALDAYQLISDDWPEEEKNNPFWLKCLFFGFDILGFVSAAAAAKAAKAGIMPLKSIANSPARIAQYFEKNPKVKGMITSMVDGIKQVPALLQSVMKTLATKFPKGASFINGILGGLKSISTRFTESLQRLLGQTAGTGASAGVKTTGVLYGFEKVIGGHETKGASVAMDPKIADQYAELVRTKYNGKDPFD